MPPGWFTRVVTFGRLEVVSFIHSTIYLSLASVFVAQAANREDMLPRKPLPKPQPARSTAQ